MSSRTLACGLWVWFAAAGAGPAVEAPGPGQWVLSSDGNRLTLLANEAELTDVLDGIREVTSVPVRFRDPPPSKVSGTYSNIRVEDLLDRFDISYTLRFVRGSDGEEELVDAWVGRYEPGEGAATPFRRPGAAAAGSAPLGEDAARMLAAGRDPGSAAADDVGVIYRSAYPVSVGLDGDPGDWPEEVPWQHVTGTMGVNGTTNNADASFAVASVSDDDFLYLAVDISDDMKGLTDPEGARFIEDDVIRLTIDNPNSGDAGRFSPEVNMSIKRHQAVQPNVIAGEALAKPQFVRSFNGTRIVLTDGGEGWFMEVAVPWEALNMSPEDLEGQAVRFDLRLADHDAEDEEPHQLRWSRTDRLGTVQVLPVR
jgi:hypothetical protein